MIKRLLPVWLLLLVGLAFLFGHTIRAQLGIDFSPAAIQAWVADLGWAGPVFYTGLVIFRQFLFLPSVIILPAGGICFGVVLGTLLGTIGIALSGVMKYWVARGVGRGLLRRQLGSSMRSFERRVETAGSLVIGLATAHPTGPMSPFHWAAGLSSIPFLPFLIAIVVGGVVRSFAYSFFGATLLEPGTPRFYAATALLLAVAIVPFLHSGLRRRIFAPQSDSDSEAPSSLPS